MFSTSEGNASKHTKARSITESESSSNVLPVKRRRQRQGNSEERSTRLSEQQIISDRKETNITSWAGDRDETLSSSSLSNFTALFGNEIPSELLNQTLSTATSPPPQQPVTTLPTSPPVIERPADSASLSSCDDNNNNNGNNSNDHVSEGNDDEDDGDDMFGDDIPFDEIDKQLALMNNTNITPEAPLEQSTVISPIRAERAEVGVKSTKTRFKRYTVLCVQLRKYIQEDKELWEKELLLVDKNHERQSAKAYLRQDWLHTQVTDGDVVNITFTSGNDETNNVWIIDNTANYLIHYPDHLISCTAVAESFFCLRKSVLQMTSKNASEFSEPLVHGAIIHETFQHCLRQKDFATSSIQHALQYVIGNSLDSLYVIGQSESKAFELLMPNTKSIQIFGSLYVGQQVKSTATVKKDMGPTSKSTECSAVAIRDILDIEEHLWSPAYGIKGMIDATVEMLLSPSKKVLTVPFELKTGKASRVVSHRAQTILYTLLLGDRYDFDINTGVLYYSKTNSLYMVPVIRSEIQALIIARNDLAAAFQRQATVLPPMIKNFHSCQYCLMNDACAIYHKSIERGTAATSGLGQWFDDHTNHIDRKAATFYRHWMRLISLEEKDLDHLRKDIWNETAEKREESGKCLKNMVLEYTQDDEIDSNWYTFKRHEVDSDALPLLSSNILVGDTIVVSSMEGHLLLGTGFATHVDSTTITISLNTPLRHVPQRDLDFDIDVNQVFVKWQQKGKQKHKDTKYRLDKDEAAGGFALMKSNLVSLMSNTSKESVFDDIHAKLRRLIVNCDRPRFTSLSASPLHPEDLSLSHLNPSQQAAIEKVMSCLDYTLILGMPGTGKSTMTAEIIKSLIKRGKSVLLTAYTHNALDNVLLKLVNQGIDVLRLGNPEKVMPSMRSYMPHAYPHLDNVAAMTEFYDSKQIVGATCYGTNHIIFRRRRFDYCIVDEASQITLPVCIGPLQYADKFILVGDQYQLPPIIKEKEARESGLASSLFAILAKHHPYAVSFLEYQYRMNEDIMKISNHLFYDNRLKCGSIDVANKSLQYSSFDHGISSIHTDLTGESKMCPGNSRCWLRDILDPSRKVVFVDTDLLLAEEQKPNENSILNERESALIYQTTETLLRCGIQEEQIAIVSVYRTQLRLINQQFAGQRKSLEIATIDKYQGRDKDCVLISLVRNNANGVTGELLRDWRRLNVAFTRAKCKLILFGSKTTLQSSSVFDDFLTLLENQRWIYALPKDAHLDHQSQFPSVNSLSSEYLEHRRGGGSPKTFSPSRANMKDRPILKDIFNYCTQE